MAAAYSIDVQLATFFKDPKTFRKLQAECNALIVGEFARDHFIQVQKRKSLTMLIEEAEAAKMMWFLESSDFKRLDSSQVPGDVQRSAHPGVRHADYRSNTRLKSVSLIIGSQTTALMSTLFHQATSTVDLNVLTWNKAYSLYTEATFVQKKAYLLKDSYEGSALYSLR
jgi:hypothetical protein